MKIIYIFLCLFFSLLLLQIFKEKRDETSPEETQETNSLNWQLFFKTVACFIGIILVLLSLLVTRQCLRGRWVNRKMRDIEMGQRWSKWQHCYESNTYLALPDLSFCWSLRHVTVASVVITVRGILCFVSSFVSLFNHRPWLDLCYDIAWPRTPAMLTKSISCLYVLMCPRTLCDEKL